MGPRHLIVSASILLALAFVVWFGVRIGLRPLFDLETAIAQRSSGDLAPIRRAVPDEVAGIVAKLNSLFGQVSQSMQAQSDFIANAAHQLRNPIAGVLALAEAVVSAKTPERARERSLDLLDAARDTADLSQKLLMLERAESLSNTIAFSEVSLSRALREWVEHDPRFEERGVTLTLDLPDAPVTVEADPVMLREAVVNLIDNAFVHGGPGLSRIDLSLSKEGGGVLLNFRDDGRGIPTADIERAMTRFVQVGDSAGSSGLGLSIVRAIIKGHGGSFLVKSGEHGLDLDIRLPLGQVV